MNLLLFSVLGFAFLFSAGEKSRSADLRAIVMQTVQVFFGAAVLGIAAKWVEAPALIPAAYLLGVILRRPPLFFMAVCGIGLSLRAPSDVFLGMAFYAAARILLLTFRQRALFYRPPAAFDGMPLLLAQAFWVSLLISSAALLSSAGFRP